MRESERGGGKERVRERERAPKMDCRAEEYTGGGKWRTCIHASSLRLSLTHPLTHFFPTPLFSFIFLINYFSLAHRSICVTLRIPNAIVYASTHASGKGRSSASPRTQCKSAGREGIEEGKRRARRGGKREDENKEQNACTEQNTHSPKSI